MYLTTLKDKAIEKITKKIIGKSKQNSPWKIPLFCGEILQINVDLGIRETIFHTRSQQNNLVWRS